MFWKKKNLVFERFALFFCKFNPLFSKTDQFGYSFFKEKHCLLDFLKNFESLKIAILECAFILENLRPFFRRLLAYKAGRLFKGEKGRLGSICGISSVWQIMFPESATLTNSRAYQNESHRKMLNRLLLFPHVLCTQATNNNLTYKYFCIFKVYKMLMYNCLRDSTRHLAETILVHFIFF